MSYVMVKFKHWLALLSKGWALFAIYRFLEEAKACTIEGTLSEALANSHFQPRERTHSLFIITCFVTFHSHNVTELYFLQNIRPTTFEELKPPKRLSQTLSCLKFKPRVVL